MFDDNESKIASGECFIIDGKGVTFRHFLNIAKNMFTVRLYMKYMQEAAPFNIRQMHLVNVSSALSKVFFLVRPFFKQEVIDGMHFHTHGLDSLHEFLPKDLLPSEYGGVLGPVNNIHEPFMKLVEAKRFVDFLKKYFYLQSTALEIT